MKTPWPWVVLFSLFVGAIVGIFLVTDDAQLETVLLSTFDALVSFIVGSAAGIAAGAGSSVLARGREQGLVTAQPGDLTWPLVVVVGVVLAALVVLFGATKEPELQRAIVGYAEAILPFVLGAGGGALVGGRVGGKLI